MKQGGRKLGNMGSIFDTLTYDHVDLNTVDETSPSYRPPSFSSQKKKVRFGIAPQELEYSDSGLTSDDGECSRFSASRSRGNQSELDALFEMTAYDSAQPLNDFPEKPDEFSNMVDLLMEDANTLPLAPVKEEFHSDKEPDLNPGFIENSLVLRDDEEEIIEEFPEPDPVQPPYVIEEVVTKPQSPVKQVQSHLQDDSSKASTSATRKKRRPTPVPASKKND